MDRSRRFGGLIVALLLAPPVGAAPTRVPAAGLRLGLVPVAEGFHEPVLVTAPEGDDRLFVVERTGRVRVVESGRVLPEPFLDISHAVETRGSEQGLLALAFHPRYRENGRFFVHYSEVRTGATIIAEYRSRVPADDVADTEERRILRVDQPYSNHNGGSIAFSPRDGFLYIGLGDGGAGGDPHGHGQNPATLLGSILRIDIDGAAPYTIPPTNPFVGVRGTRPEVWALGLRNPWRWSFDRVTGDLWIGDVGQNAWEEINHLPATHPGGANLGWNQMEGSQCFPAGRPCRKDGLVVPVVERPARPPCNSITGGHVYRGSCAPDLVGTYFFGDFCHNSVHTLGSGATHADERTEELDPDGQWIRGLSSFGEDGWGEIYLCSYSTGRIFRIVARL